jgi:HEAT repeat protein
VREAQKRLHKNVIIVLTADHGEEFHDHGGVYHGSSLYEEQVRVPLIVVAKPFAPRRVSAPVESIDLAPTLLSLVGLQPPESMRGHDLRALALGKPSERGPVFSAVIHKKMVVSWPYKLVADLRFGLFELYDLEHDPRERDNRADMDPDRVQELRGEVYAWLDALTPRVASSSAQTAAEQALEWGRLGDRRAVKPLSALMLDDSAATDARTEAARLLGKLADTTAQDALLAAAHAQDRWVAAEAAIALGRLFDERATPMLRKLVSAEDPGIRCRAAVSLGRLRDLAAVPSLIDALWFAPSSYEREEAVRWLGHLRDTRALEALINLLPEAHTRHLVVVAMGELGDRRAFAPLAQVLDSDRNENVRDGVVRGLGLLGDARALPLVVPLFSDDPSLRNAGETLVRLRALDRQLIGGADVTRGAPGSIGFGDCHVGPLHHDWDYLHRTSCTTRTDDAALRLSVPSDVSNAKHGTVAVLSVKRTDASSSAEVEVSIAGHALEPIHVDGEWSEYRWPLEPGSLAQGSVRAEIHSREPSARFEVDHLLLVPRNSDGVSAHGG